MTLQVIEMDGLTLIGSAQFHATFAATFGFLDGYGCNMNAWIDCMCYLREPSSGMTTVFVGENETLTIMLKNQEVLRETDNRSWNDLVECMAFVNRREIEDKKLPPVLALAF